MRVLVVSAPLPGHLLPMLPLADALWNSGHEVLVASGGEALAAGTGNLPAIDVARNVRFGRIAATAMVAHPVTARAELAGRGGDRGVRSVFGPVNEELADALVTVVAQWRPDVVVHEPLAASGALAAARHDVPVVLLENNLFPGRELVDATLGARTMQRALWRHGMTELPDPAVTLTIAPSSLVGQRAGLPMRPGAPDREPDPDAIPGWLRVPSERPRVLVTRTTVAGPGRGDPMAAAVKAAEGLDCELVLVRPTARMIRRMPAGVRGVGWVPLPDVLPGCAAVVHHGGAGTVLTALGAGIPQLAVPGAGDRRHNAELVAARGAGIAGPVTPEALHRLVHDGELAATARAVRSEIEAMPPPQARVDAIAALA
ncbi:nucleotide disphospho-sugar-binding domain-containing protein [Pseudonocardia endophytica]|uniref:UDP:flavonoid glycosyltransferase YjiC (YdhE family) n=1 Tax=Pseudonocardia endophytica TaxID=401976 RepID=A0A4V2PJ75_PSEEN|nr:nucleotide disphospho-sugar-binding domain-containing protein [Pseudonocardia endophytica]TCK27406.1 UDP:flavonoid glycosyltransferase YjiC (YdhE family) [Pseudonocardia endophytica]